MKNVPVPTSIGFFETLFSTSDSSCRLFSVHGCRVALWHYCWLMSLTFFLTADTLDSITDPETKKQAFYKSVNFATARKLADALEEKLNANSSVVEAE